MKAIQKEQQLLELASQGQWNESVFALTVPIIGMRDPGLHRDVVTELDRVANLPPEDQINILRPQIAVWQAEYQRQKAGSSRKNLSEILIQKHLEGSSKTDGNYLLHDIWVPWAQKMQYFYPDDTRLYVTEAAQHIELRRKQTETAWAIPNQSVIGYMSDMGFSITEIGAGRGYWAKLLRKAGLTVHAVDSGSDGMRRPLIKNLIRQDGVKYVSSGRADDGALLFCYPRKRDDNGVYVEGCLEKYKGSDIYFVGEFDDGTTYEMDLWLEQTGRAQGWQIVHAEQLPCFVGLRDTFYHFHRGAFRR